MSYTSNIPVSGDTLGGTRDRIRSNFQQISSLIGENHENFGSLLGQGKHKFLQMPELTSQTPSTAPATAANEGALYTNVGTGPAETNLFFRAENSGFEYQLTRVNSVQTGLFGVNISYGSPPAGFTQTGGWTFLPGGLILQYGFYGKPNDLGLTGSIIFPITFTNPAYSVNATIYRLGAGTRYVSINASPANNGFDFRTDTSGNDGVFWQAIGK